MVRTERSLSVRAGVSVSTSISSSEEVGGGREAMEIANTTSATESSSAEGSKRIFSPTDITRSVIGGLLVRTVSGFDPAAAVLESGIEVERPVEGERGYSGTAASQSSSKSGSSSFSDLRRGRRVERSARYVVRERSGRG